MRARYTFLAVAIVTLLTAFVVVACGDSAVENANPSGSECAVLSNIQASSGQNISGNVEQGPFSSYAIDASSQDSVVVTPPQTDNPCQQAMAAKIQGLCAVCEQSPGDPCLVAVEAAFATDAGPPPTCEVCGDGFCQQGEAECEADCGSTCGNGQCEGPLESADTCPQDCGQTCGDGDCAGDESPQSCPQDCTSQDICGNGVCDEGENAISCPNDCAECGDLICSDTHNETTNSCAIDCDICGDGVRGRSEVCDEAMADPNNENPLARKIYCPEDCG